MRRFSTIVVVVILLVTAFIAGSVAASKSHQFTGVVKAVEGDTLTVEKTGKETWTFEIGKDSKGSTPKIGERVTVNYKMVTTSIEANSAGR